MISLVSTNMVAKTSKFSCFLQCFNGIAVVCFSRQQGGDFFTGFKEGDTQNIITTENVHKSLRGMNTYPGQLDVTNYGLHQQTEND